MSAKWKTLLLGAVLAAMLVILPFTIASPVFSYETEVEEDDPFADLFGLLFPAAHAEEEEAVHYELSTDLFTPGNTPNPAGYTYDEEGNITGYHDASITVTVETRFENGVSWRVAYVEIKSPTQLRTAVAGKKITSTKEAYMSALAPAYNAIVAINGDDYQNDPQVKTFEYRMGQKASAKSNKKRDILIIDEKGDLHIFICSDADKMSAFKADGHQVVNAFTFGPGLVVDGDLIPCPKDYKYNPNKAEPRSAIGQVGPLSYVLVVAEGRGESGSAGVTIDQLGDFMFYQLNCVQAYNLDGGNTAEMYVGNTMYMDRKGHSERSINDIIYFATAVDPADWQE